MGHHTTDYNELQPVTLEESYSANDDAIQQRKTEQGPSAPVASSTQDLIALRNRLKQSQSAQEDSAEQVKKSEPTELPNLASIREKGALQSDAQRPNVNDLPEENAESTEAAIKVESGKSTEVVSSAGMEQKPTNKINPLGTSQTSPEPAPVVSTDNTHNEHIPPWALEAVESSKLESEEATEQESDPDVFDPNAHLDIDNVGAVTMDVPAFLDNKQKVTRSTQLDEWSRLIDEMQVNALTKQLALHSSFERNGDTVTLTLLAGKEHLHSPSAQSVLQQALSSAFNSNIQLEIIMGQPINTPYAVQIKINQVRQEYAYQVIKNDPGIALLKDRFAANVNEDSVQAR
ncbi:DNA polymerase III subunit gamma/tau C-terminal domain-containing protein [Paraglaciecola aquimarina]|uniref:DNA polymerase III subunit gamma/tau C-terminal domain-containing protein n=1 Tax=Paraglaciecola aquimarina TaxID=1235557 RepID=A0ABU3SXU9_9ALTE|nr:DNA polymerase III subunit gamma/tau C-terminal domain-containing protein [Paraglaciecola aquimarina]MDU0354836.1 DNA polymerase III subunit gamma/tau C-terminal domain-containing protein [Paraglaciecola aquimarina]